MNPEKLNELRELEAQATPEPWSAMHRCVGCKPQDDESWGLGLEIEGPPEADGRGQFKRGADARLIAELRNNAKALLAACERVAELEKIREAARQWAYFYALHEDGEPAIGLALDGSERGLRNALAAYEAKYGDPKEENK